MNLPENVFENPYKTGQYLKFTMNVNEVVPHLVTLLSSYQTFAISENLEYVKILLDADGIHYDEKQLTQFFEIHDVIACLFGQYGDLDVGSVWESYLKDFTENVVNVSIKKAGQTIFKAYCYRAHKLEAVQAEWGDSEIL
ncbi:hypothetical protein [Pseudomonas savastanoi]|uniref:hypothetical protein n=1 Tax=Pseudomonas savastanoi TaxID=29438 RepID=UPI000EFECE6C|nr:hypothetical protein [Pseudomonas savastanoi]RMN16504.1 hypothetical protein ALQ66_200022 [Pseudomonas savastanoi pv. glycinea]